MKHFVIFILFLVLTVGTAFSQNDPNQSGNLDELVEVEVDGFEAEGFWFSHMSSDEGLTTARLFKSRREGGEDSSVLGVRVDYLRRGYSSFTVRPMWPLPVEGETREVSVWVAGRNFNHELKLIFMDFWDRVYEVPFDKKLNFHGWQKLTAYVPVDIPQISVNSSKPMGIKIVGFRVYCDPLETRGTYYVYFDDMRAITDNSTVNVDPEDMIDGW